MSDTTQDFWDQTGLLMLVTGSLLAPFAWLLDMQISYSMVKWACENDRRSVLLAMPIGSLMLIAVGTWLCWSAWTRLRGEAREAGGRPIDRSYLLALSGLALNALFGLLILTSFVPRYFLSPCE
jgi:ABC-type nickel/cobalt efflux system permease component RcnA